MRSIVVCKPDLVKVVHTAKLALFLQVDSASRIGPMHEALEAGIVKIQDEGVRFGLASIDPILPEYPNVTKPVFKRRLDDLFEKATHHILQMTAAVTGALLAYSEKLDEALNEVPELAQVFADQEVLHQEKIAQEEAEKPRQQRRW